MRIDDPSLDKMALNRREFYLLIKRLQSIGQEIDSGAVRYARDNLHNLVQGLIYRYKEELNE